MLLFCLRLLSQLAFLFFVSFSLVASYWSMSLWVYGSKYCILTWTDDHMDIQYGPIDPEHLPLLQQMMTQPSLPPIKVPG